MSPYIEKVCTLRKSSALDSSKWNVFLAEGKETSLKNFLKNFLTFSRIAIYFVRPRYTFFIKAGKFVRVIEVIITV